MPLWELTNLEMSNEYICLCFRYQYHAPEADIRLWHFCCCFVCGEGVSCRVDILLEFSASKICVLVEVAHIQLKLEM